MPITGLLSPFLFFEAGMRFENGERGGLFILGLGLLFMVIAITQCNKRQFEDDNF